MIMANKTCILKAEIILGILLKKEAIVYAINLRIVAVTRLR